MTPNAGLDDNYAVAFGGKAGFGRSAALILIDFVEAYFDPASPLYAGVEDALASALRIRAAARAAGLPVIWTNVAYHPGGVDGGRFFEKVPALAAFVAGSAMGAWPKGLEPQADEIVLSKQYPSAFFGTSLAATLTARGIDQVILGGLSTSGCVRATCVDAMSHGFRTAVVADACGDRHPDPHKANLFDMNAKYADVVSEGAILAYLSELETAR
ncbi:isochorismatase family protein [Novosphingobium guangzhouense]|uniref:Isochorismatase n=1 Tax=Novosphingobium guangzhouense TaxID=1850347 RepID=A0A2K2G6R0_9SPHN|nr:isochorismatase family protein [Novosphingobium guangzhouense]PNU06710.1 isochorismatase [Novosphingobium guangzhouense]